MRRIGIHGAGFVPISNMGACPSVIPWWLSGGIAAANCIAAYQPKGASSLATSYINLANPGTYNAAPGVAPGWAVGTGWTFNGLTQYLTTGVQPGNQWSMFLQFTGLAVGGANMIHAGCYNAAINGMLIGVTTGTLTRRYRNGGATVLGAATPAAGNQGIAGASGFWNGALEVGGLGGNGAAAFAIYIGAVNAFGVVGSFSAITITALSIYNTDISASAAALATAMVAL